MFWIQRGGSVVPFMISTWLCDTHFCSCCREARAHHATNSPAYFTSLYTKIPFDQKWDGRLSLQNPVLVRAKEAFVVICYFGNCCSDAILCFHRFLAYINPQNWIVCLFSHNFLDSYAETDNNYAKECWISPNVCLGALPLLWPKADAQWGV